MHVILLDNIKGVGQIGDVKDVSDGYARNFLLPRNLAKPATQNSLKDVERLQRLSSQRQKLTEESAQKAADQLKDMVLEFSARANAKGTLFEGIEAKDIIQKLKEKGINIDEDAIELQEHIKNVGEHLVPINLPGDLESQIKIQISAK